MPGVCSGAAGAHGTPVPLRRGTGARLHRCVPCSSRNLALQVCKGDAATGPVSEARAQALRVLVPHNLAAAARPRHVSPSLHSAERCRATRLSQGSRHSYGNVSSGSKLARSPSWDQSVAAKNFSPQGGYLNLRQTRLATLGLGWPVSAPKVLAYFPGH